MSSAHYPQSNGRAEAAVKSAKRILQEHARPVSGDLDTQSAAQSLLLHRNTPSQDTGIPPSIMLYGRLLKDHLPTYQRTIRKEWREIAEERETALANRLVKPPPPRKTLVPLGVGQTVQVQNQTGRQSKRWQNTGTVIEELPNRQYKVMVDGSRRVTLRNRKFLKAISPICRRTFNTDNSGHPPPRDPNTTMPSPVHHSTPAQDRPVTSHRDSPTVTPEQLKFDDHQLDDQTDLASEGPPLPPAHQLEPALPPAQPTRTSNRTRGPRQRLIEEV